MNMKVVDQTQEIKINRVLNLLMHDANLNASQLSRNTGLAVTTIKRLCSEESNPTVKSLEPIAKYFNVSIAQLLGIDPTYLNREKGVTIPNVNNWLLVPILTMGECIDWPNNKESIKTRDGLEYIAADMRDGSRSLFGIRLQGQALEPRFIEDTCLIFDPARQPEDAATLLIWHKDKKLPQFKESVFDGPDMYIRSINPALPGSKIELFDESKTKVLGVLCHARSDFFANR